MGHSKSQGEITGAPSATWSVQVKKLEASARRLPFISLSSALAAMHSGGNGKGAVAASQVMHGQVTTSLLVVYESQVCTNMQNKEHDQAGLVYE